MRILLVLLLLGSCVRIDVNITGGDRLDRPSLTVDEDETPMGDTL